METIPSAGGAAAEAKDTSPKRRRRFQGLTKIAFFFALVAAIVTALDATITFGLRRIQTSKYGSLNRVVSGRVNADIVINGSSRALFHYDPRVIREITGHSTYNLGMVAAKIDIQLGVLRTYLNRNAKPKLVIQNLDGLSVQGTSIGEIYDPAAYVPYLGEEELYRALLKTNSNVWKWRYIPLYGYTVEDLRFVWVSGLAGCFGRSGPENYFQGFWPRHDAWTDDFSHFKASVGKGYITEIQPRAVAALTALIQTCRDRDIELMLVYSPEYQEAQPLLLNRREIFALFKAECEKFQVPLWDYSDSPISRSRDNFYSSQHLNAKGAGNFSTDLARRLVANGVLLRSAERHSPHISP